MTTWTEQTASTTDYADADTASNWDEHNWDEFNWDGDFVDVTWTESTSGSTIWS